MISIDKNLLFIALLLALAADSYSQINEGMIIVKSIRSVAWTRAFDDTGKEYERRPSVEIELFTAQQNGFHLGTVNGDGEFIEHSPQCLQIGMSVPIVEGGSRGKPNPNNRTRFFVLAKRDWNKMRNGEPLRLYYGCPQPSEYNSLNPIGYLDKSILDKPAPERCVLPLEFSPKLQNLGLGYHVASVSDRVLFNESRNEATGVLTLSYTGPENMTKVPEGERKYLRWQISELKRDYPGILDGIDSLSLSVVNDRIFEIRMQRSEPLKTPSIKQFAESFAKKWVLPKFWRYSNGMTEARMSCSNFEIRISRNKLKPSIAVTTAASRLPRKFS
jgi:hypothetical protein